MHRAVLLLVVACGRVGFDPSLGDAATSEAPPSAACTRWGAFAPPQRIVELSSGSTDWAPSVSSDELRMVFSSDRAGTQDLYVSTRSTATSPWSSPVLLAGFDTASGQEDDPTLTDDELEIYFGKNALFGARRASTAMPFEAPVTLVPSGTFSLVQGAELANDGLVLYFAAGDTSLALRVMTRPDRETKFSTYDLVPIASTEDLGYPTLSRDRRELIVSQALTGPSDRDLFVSTRATVADEFAAPTVIAELADEGEDWDPELSADGTTLWFASNRAPAAGRDIFVANRSCLD